MLFHSQAFVLLFMPVAVGIFYALAQRESLRNWWLIAASLVFYGWWDVRFVPLLVSQILVTWLLVELSITLSTRWPLVLAIVANLSVLGLFKYLDFGATILAQVTGLEFAKASLVLPIGISFYTFELVSYLADRLRSDAPRYRLRDFALFVVLFPHLIAGPIMRHNEIIPQFACDPLRTGVYERIGRGLILFFIGFVEKFFIADRLAGIVDPVFKRATTEVPTLADSLTGALGFSLQILFDFVAYSNMAMGIGLTLGLMLPLNFNTPYRALNLRDFWRRWHITLSRWLRDYVYIPLGGSREGVATYIWATLVTMGLCGLWHGAGWTFVLWGVAHGIGLLVCRFWQSYGVPLPSLVSWAVTMAFVVLLFVLFRAADLAAAERMLVGLAGEGGLGTWSWSAVVPIAIAGSLAMIKVPSAELAMWIRPTWPVAIGFVAVAVLCILEVGEGQPLSFIYFQF
ncbi:MBOAT family O-acyltransferase [Methyloceanibacter sp.]|uniref:MBOAT family O-acyltransferase n=1 Tax=Methyloceanibacter sp. TaxID=1965321 RepID=UPI002D38E9E4|nr:MBOAT family O-acyltransferase [Methyloceanibacter sp.]HZP10466.1 MBOAT family O-acyltransferase [Methyloceanibacter sp.]